MVAGIFSFMEKTEIILQANGTLTERVIRERELDAGQLVLDALTENVSRIVRKVMDIPGWGDVHANVGLTDTLWSVPIQRLPLRARFRLSNEVLVPVFASSTDLEMPLIWQAPAEVRLVFVVGTKFEDDLVQVEGNWLFACDQDKRGYRLPLPNLHDDCRICTGAFADHCETAFECVAASLEQFNKSKWNADLMRTVEQSQKFFRFRPTNETFETLPILSDDWTLLCDKVSTAIMERVVL
jgi:hypothetical protein